MSVLERRLQVLLDQQRYERVAAEARRTGRSVGAVIRTAIDVHLPAEQQARLVALTALLDGSAVPRPEEVGEDWAQVKAAIEEELDHGARA